MPKITLFSKTSFVKYFQMPKITFYNNRKHQPKFNLKATKIKQYINKIPLKTSYEKLKLSNEILIKNDCGTYFGETNSNLKAKPSRGFLFC